MFKFKAKHGTSYFQAMLIELTLGPKNIYSHLSVVLSYFFSPSYLWKVLSASQCDRPDFDDRCRGARRKYVAKCQWTWGES